MYSTPNLPIDITQVKGFMPADEGAALYDFALRATSIGPCLEIGSYCGKSTVYLGVAYQQHGGTVFSVDHHRGSEEHQPGEEYFDTELFDQSLNRFNSFDYFLQTVDRSGLGKTVVPIVADASLVARDWQTPLGMLFIDGGHSEMTTQTDYVNWVGHVRRGGILAIHDVFPNPKDGGRPPFNIYRQAVDSALFETLTHQQSLYFLQRK